MNISKEGITFLEKYAEGKRSTVYNDSNGKPTIGIGHLLTKDELSSGKIVIKYANPHNNEIVKYRDGLTDKQIYALLVSDLVSVEGIINIAVKVPLTQNQYDALVSFVFNVGNTAFVNSTLLKVLNQGKYEEVPTQMRRWVHGDGKVIEGLVNRREKDVSLWNGTWRV